MFTGIIEEIGAVSRVSGADLAIMAETVLDDLRIGDSVAVNGVCLTVAALNSDNFVAQVSQETLKRTTIGQLRPGDAVNLERALPANGRLGGHFVAGHVDAVGRIAEIRDQGDFAVFRFQAPDDVTRYVVPKGSISVDGISLTVIDPSGDTFGVAVIPTTLGDTTLGMRRVGDHVNLEADLIGRYLYHFAQGNGSRGVTMGMLAENGFL